MTQISYLCNKLFENKNLNGNETKNTLFNDDAAMRNVLCGVG